MLSFDERSHTYRLDGVVVPGVTSILRPLVDFSGIPPRVLEAKADLGRRVHLACQLDDENDLDEESVEEDVAGYLAGYRKFRIESGAAVLCNELMVCSPDWRYAGTLDRVFALKGARWLVDIKSCIATPHTTGPQTAAYLRAYARRYGETAATKRAALRLLPDGSYRFEPLHDPDDWATFLACLTIRRHLEKHQ